MLSLGGGPSIIELNLGESEVNSALPVKFQQSLHGGDRNDKSIRGPGSRRKAQAL